MSDTETPVAEPLTVTVEDGVVVVRLDDGKLNVIGHRTIELVHAALDRALAEATAVAVVGRPGVLSAGYDLNEVRASDERMRALVGAGGHLAMRIFAHPQPVVIGVTGHALAAGAIISLACDTRIGADVDAKIGLNETAIGMPLPVYATELSKARLTARGLVEGTLQGGVYDVAGALEVGFLDRVVPAAECEQAAIETARRLGRLRPEAYSITKALLRAEVAERVDAGIDENMATLLAPTV
ncbi:MAG: crotonase/enoyl-CoA hydratase family protein [Acidimicrobiia bacterium]